LCKVCISLPPKNHAWKLWCINMQILLFVIELYMWHWQHGMDSHNYGLCQEIPC
jgi:hypothetical protein